MKHTIFFFILVAIVMTMNACTPVSSVQTIDDTIKVNGIDYIDLDQPIAITKDNIIDILYSPEEGKYYIEYENIFNEDFGDYIKIYIADIAFEYRFEEFMMDYDNNNLDDWYIDHLSSNTTWLSHDLNTNAGLSFGSPAFDNTN